MLVPLLEHIDPELRSGLQGGSGAWNTQAGQPRVLVVSHNANRCTDLARVLRAFFPPPPPPKSKKDKYKKGGSKKNEEHGPIIAKLFARHIKRSEQASLLLNKPTPMAVGTPGRIETLLSAGAGEERAPLNLASVRWIVLDVSWTDAKQFSLLDSPDTKCDVFRLLTHTGLRSRLGLGTKLVLF